MPNILHVLISYIKYNLIKKAVYIYDNNESSNRIYEFLQLMNRDEYFNNFSLDFRTTDYEDIYSLLYTIDTNSFHKDQLPKLVLLDLYSYKNYEIMFEKISHMGLTSNSYQYIILSTFDVCLWINKLNFGGQLIYFDYHQRNCTLNHLKPANVSPTYKHHRSYYQPTISLRHYLNAFKSLNSKNASLSNSSLSSNETDAIYKLCHAKLHQNDEYLSYAYFNSQLPNSSYSLYSTVNLIIRILTSNILHCQTYRLKSLKKKRNLCHFADVNIYSARKTLSNQLEKEIQLIGRYSTIDNHYQSCQMDKSKDVSKMEKSFSSKIYYITSLFDEPFLMLRKRMDFQTRYNQTQPDLKELRGQIFNFNELEGFCVDLAEEVCSILNITCRFRIVQDGAFGSKNSSTGIWSGE